MFSVTYNVILITFACIVRLRMEKVIYTVVVTTGCKTLGDLEDKLKFVCTDKKTLSDYTGISYDRLTYVFTRLGRTFLWEKDNMVIKTTSIYKSRKGGFRVRKRGYSGFNRNI